MLNIFGKEVFDERAVERSLIIGKVKNSLDNTEPSEELSARILRKIEGGTQTRPQKRRRFFTKPRAVLVLGLTVLAMAFGATVGRLNLPAGHIDIAVMTKALAAIEKPRTVTYYKISTHSSDPRYYNSKSDFWISADKNTFKFNNYDLDFKRRQTIVLANNRLSIAGDENGRVHVSEGPYKNPQFGTGDGSYLMNVTKEYYKLLKAKKLRVVGEEKVNGIATYKLAPVETWIFSFDSEDIRVGFVNVGKDDYQPVRIVNEFGFANAPGFKLMVTSTYEDVKLVAADSLGQNFFTVDDRLKGEDYELSATYSLEEAKHFSKFDLFYLGKSFLGYKVWQERVDYDHQPKKPFFPEEGPARKAPSDTANISYEKLNAKGEQQDVIYIGMSPAKGPGDMAEYIKAFSLLDMKKTPIRIDGSAGTLIEGYEVLSPGSNDDTKAYRAFLILSKGNSILRIEATDNTNSELGTSKELEIKAAKNLIKIN